MKLRRKLDPCAAATAARDVAFVVMIRIHASDNQQNHHGYDKEQTNCGKNTQVGLLKFSRSPTFAIGTAVVEKSFLGAGAARDVIPEIAIPDHIDRQACQRGDQRENDNDRVQHFFASCDVLNSNLSQVAGSPKT